MIGILTTIRFIEDTPVVSSEMVGRIKQLAAEKAQRYFNKPAEDILLMVDRAMENI